MREVSDSVEVGDVGRFKQLRLLIIVALVSFELVADSIGSITGPLRILKLFLFLHKTSGLSTGSVAVVNIEKVEVAEESVHESEVYESATAFLERFKPEPEERQNLVTPSINLRSIHLNHALVILVSKWAKNGLVRRRHKITALDIVNAEHNYEFVYEFVNKTANLVDLRQQRTNQRVTLLLH